MHQAFTNSRLLPNYRSFWMFKHPTSLFRVSVSKIIRFVFPAVARSLILSAKRTNIYIYTVIDKPSESTNCQHIFNFLSCIFLGSPCEHDGICVNTPGSFACNCAQGFTGPRCETNVNECESHPCQNDGSCLDDPGTFRCVCMPGKSNFFPPFLPFYF